LSINPKISHKGEGYLVTRKGTIIRQKDYSILNLSEGDELYDTLQEQAMDYFGNKDLNAINQRDLRSDNMDNIFSKALQKSISTGNWTEETLNELDTLTNKKENGQLLFKRFPQEVGTGITGILAKAEALISGSSQGTSVQSFKDRLEQFQVRQSEGKEQEQAVESWAKEEGIWLNDYTDNKANPYPSLETMLSSEYEESYGGSESYVYQDKEHQEVVKAISLLHCDDNVQIALDRMVLHNQLFPNTAYSIIGFGRDSLGHFRIIAKQKFVQGESASSEEIKNFAEKLGLREEQGWWYSQDGLFKITDLSPLNVLKDINGELQVIDCDIELVSKATQQSVESFENENYKNNRNNVSQRLSQEELRSSDGNLQKAETILTRRSRADDKGSEAVQGGMDEEVSSREDEEKLLKTWAQAENLWYENIDDELQKRYGNKIGHGSESWVYLKDKKTVIKSRSTTQFNSIRDAIESVILHNILNPNTAYTLVGIGKSDGEFTLMLEQPLIEGRNATQEEIDSYMEDLGFEQSGQKTNFHNSRYRYEDLKPANVIIDADGSFNVIDSDVYIKE